tara:strand:- start:23156 stop:23359 length:204 start_codon:yes stop_codon:yes gene_type:complete
LIYLYLEGGLVIKRVEVSSGRSKPIGNIPYQSALGEMAAQHPNQMCPAVKSLEALIRLLLLYQLLEN